MNVAASTGFRLNYNQVSTQAFAIPIARALSIARQIQTGETTATVHVGPTAMLGVSVRPTDMNGFGDFGTVGGARHERAAELACGQGGHRAGSVITLVGTKKIGTPDDLSRAMLRLAPKDNVGITWLDQFGRRANATVSLAAGPPQ